MSGARDEDYLSNLEEVLLETTSKCWLTTSEEQVCVHGTSSYLPGSQGQQGRNSSVRRQRRRHHQCTSAEECVGAKVILRHDQLLPKVSAYLSSLLAPLNE